MSGVLRFKDAYYEPGPNSLVAWDGRVRFLNEVRLLQRRVLEELRDLLEQQENDRSGFLEAVREWAARWRLTPVDPIGDDWIRVVAEATCGQWRDYPELLMDENVTKLGLRWHFPSHPARYALSREEEGVWQLARRRKRRSAEFGAIAKARGFVPSPTLREPHQFSRLARYQILGESYGAISCDEHLDRRTLQRGLRATAKLIGLRLRSPGRPPGRPRGRGRGHG